MYPILQSGSRGKKENVARRKFISLKMAVGFSTAIAIPLQNKFILSEITQHIFLRYISILQKKKHYEIYLAYINFFNTLLLSKIVEDRSLENFLHFKIFHFSNKIIFLQVVLKQYLIDQTFRDDEIFKKFLDMQRHLFEIKRSPVSPRTFKTLFSTRNLHYPKFVVTISPVIQ